MFFSSIAVTGGGLAWLWGRIDKKFEKVELSVKELRSELKSDIHSLEVKMDQRFEKVDQRFEKVDQRFEKIDQRFEKVDQRFERLEQKLEEIPKIKLLVMNIQWNGKIPRDVMNKEIMGED